MFISLLLLVYCLVIVMVSDWRLIEKINVELVLNVSSRGDGLVLFLPKNVAETYQVLSGDRVKCALGEHFRKKVEE